MIVDENANNADARGSSENNVGKASPAKGLKSPVAEPGSGRRRSRRLSGASADFEANEYERSVEKQDKVNRRMTVDPNELLGLDLDDDDEDEGAVEEKTVHTTRSEPNGRRSSVAGKGRRMSRRATIEPEDITALLNDSTTSSKMEALTTASPAGTASRRSSRSSVGSKRTDTSNVSKTSLDEDEEEEEEVNPAPKNDRRVTMDAMNIDNILNEELEEEEAASIPSKGRRHSVASFAHEGSTMEFRSGNGIRTHFNDDGNTQMTHLSSATIASMAPSETQTHGLTADLARTGADDDDDARNNVETSSRRRQTMVEGRDLGLPSPSPLKPRAQSLAPGDIPFARSASTGADRGGDMTENLTTRTEPVGTSSASASALISSYRPKSALKGARRSSAAAEGHSVDFTVNMGMGVVKDDDTNTSINNSKYVMFGSPKVAEFDKEGPSNALTPLDKADAKAMFSMTGAGGEEGDQDDVQTEQNSTILEQWDRLTNDGSDSENEDDDKNDASASGKEGGDRSGPLPTLGASRRSSIGLGSRRGSLGGADLLHFDNTEELTAHSVIGRYSIGSTNDKTAELEPDLMAMLHNYDQRLEDVDAQNGGEEDTDEDDEEEGEEKNEMVLVDAEVEVDARESSTSVVMMREESEGAGQDKAEEEADSDASTEEDEASVDRSLHNTSMSFSLMLNDSTVGENAGASVLDRLKSLNSSSRRTTLDHASRTPTGSRLSLNKRRATIRSRSKNMASAAKVLSLIDGDVNDAAEATDSIEKEGQEEAAAVGHQVALTHANETSFIESAPPVLVLQSPASSIKGRTSIGGKRSSRSAPTSPLTPPLSQEKQLKRSRRKSPGKSPSQVKTAAEVSLDAFLSACGPLQPVRSKDSEGDDCTSGSGSAMAYAAGEVAARCPLLPAFSSCMEAILKHSAESSAVAKSAVDDLPTAASQWQDCDEEKAISLPESTLLSLGQAATAAATHTIAKEQNKLLDAVARQLERKAKEVRNRAKTIRRASVKLLTMGSVNDKGEDTLNAEMLSAQLLADVQAEVHMARRHIEDMNADMERVSDETSAALEEKKEQLVIFTSEYCAKTDADQAVSMRLQELEAQLASAEGDVCDTRTKIGVMQSITHHTLKSFRPSSVSFDCSLSAGVKAVVDFHTEKTGSGGYFISDVCPRVERTSIHSGVSGLDAGNDNVVSENMAAAAFYAMVFNDKDGPLSQAAIRDLTGQPFVSVHNTVQVFAGYISSFRLVLSKLKLFADDGWNWTLQNRDVVLFTPDDRYKLTIPMDVLISGNIAAVSTQCLRNRDDRPVAELPIKAVLTSLRNKYAGVLGNFQAAAIKRELDSILKYL